MELVTGGELFDRIIAEKRYAKLLSPSHIHIDSFTHVHIHTHVLHTCIHIDTFSHVLHTHILLFTSEPVPSLDKRDKERNA